MGEKRVSLVDDILSQRKARSSTTKKSDHHKTQAKRKAVGEEGGSTSHLFVTGPPSKSKLPRKLEKNDERKMGLSELSQAQYPSKLPTLLNEGEGKPVVLTISKPSLDKKTNTDRTRSMETELENIDQNRTHSLKLTLRPKPPSGLIGIITPPQSDSEIHHHHQVCNKMSLLEFHSLSPIIDSQFNIFYYVKGKTRKSNSSSVTTDSRQCCKCNNKDLAGHKCESDLFSQWKDHKNLNLSQCEIFFSR
ncbi:uncharacterized protein [Pyxicephalus adspersus]|uniref:uncharacterized protein n=1 Tax=Pyxicephalus adspersus TaxID=30357 RepID=UPI003B5C0800